MWAYSCRHGDAQCGRVLLVLLILAVENALFFFNNSSFEMIKEHLSTY